MNQEIETKKCSNPNCDQPIKPINEFHKKRETIDGLSTQCKNCRNLSSKKYYKLNTNKKKEYAIKNDKKIKTYQKEWRSKNQYKIKQTNESYYLYNKSKISKNCKKYYDRNKKHIITQQNKHNKKRRKVDLYFDLYITCRNRIYNVFRYKNESTKSLLGISFKEYKEYLETLFYDNMTWKKRGSGYGKWQIHHICPLEFFELSDPIEQKQAFHYTNTKPLWYEDHCEEHRKINERRKD